MRSRIVAALVALAALPLAGCGQKPAAGTVTGRVTLAGQPLTAGQVLFIPRTGVPVAGTIHADGTYRVENVLPGEAIITVIVRPPDYQSPADRMQGQKKPPEHGGGRPPAPALKPFTVIPARYADQTTSGLRYTVQAGENSHDILLTQ